MFIIWKAGNTPFWRSVDLQTSFFSKSSRRRLQKGSVLRGKKQEIFREREFRVLPETMRNEELIAEHYLGLWAGPASTFVKGGL